MTQAVEKKICALYKKGRSLRDIAAVAKVSHETIRTILNKYGFVRKLERKNIDQHKVRQEYKKLQCYEHVAKKFGISRAYVFQIVNRENKKRKRKRTRV